MEWAEVVRDWPAYTDSMITRWPNADAEIVADMDPDREAFEVYIAGVQGMTTLEAEADVARWLEGPKPLDAVNDPNHVGTSITESGASIPVGEDVYADDRKFGDDNISENPVGRS